MFELKHDVEHYSEEDYYAELRRELEREDPKINYKFQRKARKNYICECCGREIHRNEYYWLYKPNPTYNKRTKRKKYHQWRKRCFDCEPRRHSELDMIKDE